MTGYRHYWELHIKRCLSRATYDFKCSECGHRFNSNEGLATHLSSIHRWSSRKCDHVGSTNDGVFATPYELTVYRDGEHRGRINRGCPIAEFSASKKVYSRIFHLKRHVHLSHPDFDEDELTAFLPPEIVQGPESFTPQRCSYPGCGWLVVYQTKSALLVGRCMAVA